LIQCWAHAFKKNPNFKIVEDYYNAMKYEGVKFPKLNETEAMFDVEEAPQWIHDSESSNCFRCRAEFGPIRRRHHCRACGQIFCHACSAKQAPIPKYGIEKEVRVCDSCYDKLIKSAAAGDIGSTNPAIELAKSLSKQQQPVSSSSQLIGQPTAGGSGPVAPSSFPKEKSEQEFEEELQLALALSESEAEAKKKQSSKQTKSSSFSNKNSYSSLGTKSDQVGSSSTNASAPYIDINTPTTTTSIMKQEKKKSEAQPALTELVYEEDLGGSGEGGDQNEEEFKINKEIFDFREEIRKLLEIYINRMKSDSMRGRSITNDTAVQSLFLQLQHLHPKLLAYIKYKEDARGYYENLQDKLTQLKDAREALNALRQENYEKKRLEMEEKERLRQVQISQKLQLMRQQKQSYYLMQNQLNLKKLQDQEYELRVRLDQQREMVMKRELVVNVAPVVPPQAQLAFGASMPPNRNDPNYLQMLESSLESLKLQQSYIQQQLLPTQQQQQLQMQQQSMPPQQMQQQQAMPQQMQQMSHQIPQMVPPNQYQQNWQSMAQQQPAQQQQQPLPNNMQAYYESQLQAQQQQQQQQQHQQQQYLGMAAANMNLQASHNTNAVAPVDQQQQTVKVAELISFD
jgi:growth factor-regulated tyrosine kinase substrate